MVTSVQFLLIMITIIMLVRLLGNYLNLQSETKRIRDLRSRAASEHVERKTPTPRARGASRLTASQNARITDLYQAGWKPVDIAREVGTTEWTVHHRLNRLGIARRPTSLTPEQCREAVRQYQDGESLRQIGLKLGFNDKTVKKAVIEAGVAIRPTSRHPRSAATDRAVHS
jgi:DNA-binding NarL/FixJ family response regulator